MEERMLKKRKIPNKVCSLISIAAIFALLSFMLCACSNSKAEGLGAVRNPAASVSPEASASSESGAPSSVTEAPPMTAEVTASPAADKTVKAEKTIVSNSKAAESEVTKVPEGIFVGSDEYYNFYLNDDKIHSVRYSGTEVDNDTFAYNSFLYFATEKGIYNLKSDGTELQLLLKNGVGNLGGTGMTITKVEKGTVYYELVGLAGKNNMRYRIPNDPAWTEPVSFGQFWDAKDIYKFCFDENGIIYITHSYNQNETFCDMPLSKAQISYGDYIYFMFACNIYRVTPQGTGFECYYIPENKADINYLEIDKIENGSIYYSETTGGGHTVTEKQLTIT